MAQGEAPSRGPQAQAARRSRHAPGTRPAPAQTRHGGDAGDRLPPRRQDLPMRLESQGQVPATCPSCRSTGMHVMGFQLKDGNTAQMRRCGRCEWKSWWLDGRQVSLAELLAVVQETGLPRAKRSPAKGR